MRPVMSGSRVAPLSALPFHFLKENGRLTSVCWGLNVVIVLLEEINQIKVPFWQWSPNVINQLRPQGLESVVRQISGIIKSSEEMDR